MPLGAATASFEPLAENARDIGTLIGAAFGGVAGAASVLGAESVRSSYRWRLERRRSPACSRWGCRRSHLRRRHWSAGGDRASARIDERDTTATEALGDLAGRVGTRWSRLHRSHTRPGWAGSSRRKGDASRASRNASCASGVDTECCAVLRERNLKRRGQRRDRPGSPPQAPAVHVGLGADGLTTADQREHEQSDGNRRNRKARHHEPALTALVRLPAREQVLALQCRRTGIGAELRAREPGFGHDELAPPQQEATVTRLRVPFDRLRQPPRVFPAMLEIRVERLHHAQERRIGLAVLYERDPVALPDLGRNVGIGNTRPQNGHDALAEFPT